MVALPVHGHGGILDGLDAARRAGGRRQDVGQILAVQAPRRERVVVGAGAGQALSQPVHEVVVIVGQPAHAAGGDVEQIRLVRRFVGNAARRARRIADQRQPALGGQPMELRRYQRAAGSGSDHRHMKAVFRRRLFVLHCALSSLLVGGDASCRAVFSVSWQARRPPPGREGRAILSDPAPGRAGAAPPRLQRRFPARRAWGRGRRADLLTFSSRRTVLGSLRLADVGPAGRGEAVIRQLGVRLGADGAVWPAAAGVAEVADGFSGEAHDSTVLFHGEAPFKPMGRRGPFID
jgi:hypothetical protein